MRSPLKTAAKALNDSGHTTLAKIPEGISAFSGLGQDLARWSENTARGANFIDKLKKGYSPKAAAAIVDKTSFNYADRSDLLNKAREIFPFATFAWKNVPLQIEQGLTNQKPFAVTGQLLNAANSDPDTRADLATAEDFQVNSIPVRIPDAAAKFLGADKENNNTYVPIQRHLPMTQVITRGLADPQKIVENLIGSTGPWKALAEVAMNKNTMSGRPIDTLLTSNDPAFSRETVPSPIGDIGAKYDYLLRNLIPQYGQAARLLGYEKKPKPFLTRMIRDVTGLSPINVDRDKNEASQQLRVKISVDQIKNELRKALKDGDQQKADQIQKLLDDDVFMNMLTEPLNKQK